MKTLEEVKVMVASSKKGSTTTDLEVILRRVRTKEEDHKKRHSLPEPEGMTVTAELRDIALEISREEDTLVKYLRNQPIAHMRYDANGREEYFFQVGTPKMTLLAFLQDEKIHIGWSKRDTTRTADGQEIEPVKFSKRNARYVATLRALTDTITVKGNCAYTKDGNPISYAPGRVLRAFADRAMRWFRTAELANVTFE